MTSPTPPPDLDPAALEAAAAKVERAAQAIWRNGYTQPHSIEFTILEACALAKFLNERTVK